MNSWLGSQCHVACMPKNLDPILLVLSCSGILGHSFGHFLQGRCHLVCLKDAANITGTMRSTLKSAYLGRRLAGDVEHGLLGGAGLNSPLLKEGVTYLLHYALWM